MPYLSTSADSLRRGAISSVCTFTFTFPFTYLLPYLLILNMGQQALLPHVEPPPALSFFLDRTLNYRTILENQVERSLYRMRDGVRVDTCLWSTMAMNNSRCPYIRQSQLRSRNRHPSFRHSSARDNRNRKCVDAGAGDVTTTSERGTATESRGERGENRGRRHRL